MPVLDALPLLRSDFDRNEKVKGTPIMPLTCANCGARVELSESERRRLAGKYFACPECGVARRLRPSVAATTNDVSFPPADDRVQLNPRSSFRQRLSEILAKRGRWTISIFAVVACIAVVLFATQGRPIVVGQTERGGHEENARAEKPDDHALPKEAEPAANQGQPPKDAREPPVPENKSMFQRMASKLTEPSMPPIAAIPEGKTPALVDPQEDRRVLQAVRLLLRDTLPNGNWTEVLWWPTRILEIPSTDGDLRPKVMARLRIRAENKYGALQVFDLLFVIENDHVRFANREDDARHLPHAERMFDLGMKRFTPAGDRMLLDALGWPGLRNE
jgi:predicted RNA-binding Zn-ribbon protein involved in translation (DUF1610 family)